MKAIILVILFLFMNQIADAQQKEIDSLNNVLKKQKRDTNEVITMTSLSQIYLFKNPDSAVILAKNARDLARKLHYSLGEGVALTMVGEASHTIGDFPQSLEALFDALRIGMALKNRSLESNSLDFLGIAYVDLGEYRQGLEYLFRAKKMNDEAKIEAIAGMKSFRLSNIGHAYQKLGKKDSALFFQEQAKILQDTSSAPERALILTRLGVIHADLGNQTQALYDYRAAIQIGDVLNVGIAQYHLAELFHMMHQQDSSLYYGGLAFKSNQISFERLWLLETSNLLATLYYEKNNIDSAFHYQRISAILKDSLFDPEKFQRLQLLAINEQQRQQEIQQEKEKLENNIKLIALVSTVGVFIILAIILYSNNRQKQKTNKVLVKALTDLKSTQSQLIQSEKMASLGELTAGIAHEIQNPLNFVNNFSEVSKEMLEELKAERLKPNGERDESLQDDLINDVFENSEKILHHGKRADAIVKGMLQHSRASTGKKELTDINALADEYLRLSYHGMRAKDKSFNAEMKTYFDHSIVKINIVPQDMGRVLLNLFNNAFYSVNEKKKIADENYKPEVSVQTKKLDDKIEIKVSDNGNGIPQNIIDKIFQPFFTTKPTGSGTGLGLSLSYDIITKEHNGTIKVESREGERSEFVIQLPL